jgi:hypothetical protein
MKILNTEKSILSLENIRRVDMHVDEIKHVSYDKPHTIISHEVWITYTDKSMERIQCGEDEKGHTTAKLLMDKIIEILSEESW